MIGLVVVASDVLAEAFLTSLQIETGKQENICAVSVSSDEDTEVLRGAILDAISMVEDGRGVLVFTESASTSSGHVMISLMDKANIAVVTGVNFPMLIKVAEQRTNLSLEDLAALARDEGRKGITLRDG